MSKYGPAWVWLATGQSLRQVTPSSSLHERGSQPVNSLNPCHTLSLATGGGVACVLPLDKRKVDTKCLGDLLNQEFAPKCSEDRARDQHGPSNPQMPMPPKGRLLGRWAALGEQLTQGLRVGWGSSG